MLLHTYEVLIDTAERRLWNDWKCHNLTKAFESLFGSVTCLPGCFTMYRIRAADSGKPLFVSKDIIEQYSEIRVDTLHMKNLLHLGEDRYLTTLLLKHHGNYKTKYIFRAHAWTIAPDNWKVFVASRIHERIPQPIQLFELLVTAHRCEVLSVLPSLYYLCARIPLEVSMETIQMLPLAKAEVEGRTPTFLERLFDGKLQSQRGAVVGDDLVQLVLLGGFPEAISP